jgi:hypothetical protein
LSQSFQLRYHIATQREPVSIGMGLSELREGVWRTEKLVPTQDQYRHTSIGSQCCNELCLHLCGGIP